MNGTATEVLDLVARWVHVIAGIMWVGNSLLFNWLDRNLVAHSDQTSPPTLRSGGKQSIWLLHSGGFYFVEKTLLPGQALPTPLHWFKWQAYTTWLSGVALLVIIYWAGGRAVMADPSLQPMSHSQAVLIGIGSVIAGWLTYEFSNRFIAPQLPKIALVTWVVVLTAIAFVLTQTLNGRAAYLHVGAMLGTIMAGNVFFTIVPSQRKLVASVADGREESAAAVSARAKRVSIHNNYFTFPVIVLMVSSHFPAIYGGPRPWQALLVLIVGGAAARHLLNTRFTFPYWLPLLGLTILATVAALLGITRVTTTPLAIDGSDPAAFADVRRVIDRRCSACHSAQPSDMTFAAAPGGVMFDTPAQIASHVNRIRERAIISRTMPPANKTNITDAERALLARWIMQGAVIR